MGMNVDGQTTRAGDLDYLADIRAAGLDTDAKVGLFLASFSPSRDTTLAEMTAAEPTFNGYDRQAATFSSPGVGEMGNAHMMSENVIFHALDAVTPEIIGGAFLCEESVGPPVVNRLLSWYLFPTPISVQQAGQEIGVKVVVTTPNLEGYAMVER